MNAPSQPPSPELGGVIAAMRESHGLDVSAYADTFLAASLERRRRSTAHRTTESYLAWLTGDRAEADVLAGTLHVSFSEFFRDPFAFALLEQTILPGLARSRAHSGRGEIRVWSAGCAAGQEAWSVAILLDELAARSGYPVPHRILATDTSAAGLETAATARYSTEAVGNLRLRQLGSAFVPRGEEYEVLPRIRDRVDFSCHDLLDPATSCPPASIYGDFDLVICSNVLLYYRPEAQTRILDKVRASLAPGGCLVTGETEQQIVANAGGFVAVAPPAPVFRRAARGR